MDKLQFDPAICKDCETVDCLMKCQYMDFTLSEAKTERMKIVNGEDSRVLHECATCYACDEYCPNSNHPWYHLVDFQEKRGILPAPAPIAKMVEGMWRPRGDVDYQTLQAPVIHMCGFHFLAPLLLTGRIFEGTSFMGGNDVHCHIYASHFARLSLTREKLVETIENIQKYHLENNGIDELVCFHDECYATFMSFAPAYGIEVPFKPIHFFEFLKERLQAIRDEFTPLGVKAAYQRPCSNRLIPKTEQLVDEVCDLIGVERVARKYDRENALCCAAILRVVLGHDEADDILKRNLDDMVEHEAEYCIFNCPMCFFEMEESVSKRGIKPVLLSDLCKIAVGESSMDLDALAKGYDMFSI